MQRCPAAVVDYKCPCSLTLRRKIGTEMIRLSTERTIQTIPRLWTMKVVIGLQDTHGIERTVNDLLSILIATKSQTREIDCQTNRIRGIEWKMIGRIEIIGMIVEE
uniref:Uncharacterized protein n=1 Tax=Cacopsylla melanoneura TaxID=428564 RepID=A0A8D9BTR0_9HEMI